MSESHGKFTRPRLNHLWSPGESSQERDSEALGASDNVNQSSFPHPAPRFEPADEEESNLESASDSEAKLSSEEPRDSDFSDVDLDSAARQLQEFIPGIRARAATTIKRMYRDDLERFKEFKAQGEPGGAAPPLSSEPFRAVAPRAARPIAASSSVSFQNCPVRVESLAKQSVRVFLLFAQLLLKEAGSRGAQGTQHPAD